MKEIYTRSDGATAIIGVEDGKYIVDFEGKRKAYKSYPRALGFLENNGFCTAFKKCETEVKTMKTNATIETYTFDDMTVKVITDPEEANVYLEIGSNLIFAFGVAAKDAGEIDIEKLHENGYFDIMDVPEEE